MTRHIRGFDTLRLIALFAVVWIHGSDTNPLAGRLRDLGADAAVPAFLLMAAYLMMASLSKSPAPPFGDFMRRRWTRLGLPYLAWTVLYLLFRLAKHTFAVKQPLVVDWVPTVFCGAAAYHLWFIPALLYLTALFFPLFRAARDRAGPWAPIVALLLAAAMLGAFLVVEARHAITPGVSGFLLLRLLGYGACMPLGAAIWLAEHGPRQWLRPRTGPGVPLLAVGMWAAAVAVRPFPHVELLYVTLLALGAFLLALAWPRTEQPVPRWLAETSALTFGIYLVHGMCVEGLQVVAGMAHVSITGFPATLGIIVASYGLSLLGAAGLSRVPACRWLVRVG